ncbi:MAG: glucose 1-dehydrogenase [Acidobacteriota bacterium]|jgi:NAD(P)-dependent dehydrogenase (short-subunit alcohol dehydrogenase family)
MGRVQDKVAIVTGGARGLGKATSVLLAQEGAHVVAVDIEDELGIEVVKEILGAGDSARYRHMDVTSEEDIERVCREVGEEYGHIDILVNNAGVSGILKQTHEISVLEWDRVLDIDAKGVFLCTKHAVPYMKKNGGSIVNISSVYGIVAGIDNPPPYLYHAAKGAVRMMTKSDAVCYAKDGIRVNSIHPGWIWTPMLDEVGRKAPEGQDEFNRRLLSHIPLGHYGEPRDVACGVLYFASDESKFVTGSELVIDGGYIAW